MNTRARRKIRRRSALFLLAICAASARAQEPASSPDPADVASIEAIIGAVYDVISGDAGVERDWDRMRSLFHPEARLIPAGPGPAGEYVLRPRTLEQWIAAASGWFAENPFFEVEIFRIEERYGHIAHAFSTYESRRRADGAPFTRGINSFQLLRASGRWWIVNIYWQGESESEPIPARYLPG